MKPILTTIMISLILFSSHIALGQEKQNEAAWGGAIAFFKKNIHLFNMKNEHETIIFFTKYEINGDELIKENSS